MSNILLICHDIPSMTVGATLPIYHLIKHLGKKHDIHLICFDSKRYSADEIKNELKEITTLDIPEYKDLSGQFRYTFKNMISIDNLHSRSLLNYYYRQDMSKLIQNSVTDDVDVIITDMPMAFYVKNVARAKIVYAFDAVSDYNYRMYKKSSNITSQLYWYLNYWKIHRYEQVYNSFNYCILVNEKDKQLLEKDIKIPLAVIPNGVDTDHFINNSVEEEVKLVFLGDMSTPPNNDAVKYFVDNIYPDVLKEMNIPFYIVGRNPSPYICNLNDDDNINVTGCVDDVREYLTRGCIFITPMISGTGIKNKILEAMSMQLPVISTSIGISGINAEDSVNYLLSDSSEDFKNNILLLAKNSDLRETIGNNARLFVENNYSWKTSMENVDKIIHEITPEIFI